MAVSNRVKTPRGLLTVGDVVLFEAKLGKVLLILRSGNGDVGFRFWAVLGPFKLKEGTVDYWVAELLQSIVVELELLSSAMCYCIIGDRVCF